MRGWRRGLSWMQSTRKPKRIDDEMLGPARHLSCSASLNVMPVTDRTYFHSIYSREPSDMLFEIATEPIRFNSEIPINSDAYSELGLICK
jgi:hypothetical protein